MDHTETINLIEDALASAVAGDAERAADRLCALGENSDDNRMYGVCGAIANAGKYALGLIYGDQMAQPERGDMFVLEELKPGTFADDPAKAFAARFLVAWCNDDRDTTVALFNAALRSEQYVESVSALLANVAGIVRLGLDEKKKGGRR
ncbi:MAG: hypothetical protein HOY79_50010 [Streptomyces sp.]|nr:hypothetical protein [Streptomyces sp.]